MATLRPTRIENTCCPICGRGIEPRMGEVMLHLADASRVLIRIDSARCAHLAERHPDRVHEAARANQIAHVGRAIRPA